jgi:phosphoribosylanthranilate isomerase
MSVVIKICGITSKRDARDAIAAGAQILGLNFYAASPRYISLETAQKIADAVGERALLAGVFVNATATEVRRIARAVPLNIVQLHGDEPPEMLHDIAGEFELLRACKATPEFSPAALAAILPRGDILLDTPTPAYGGSGCSFEWRSINWSALRAALPGRLFLAGGLHAGNVGEAITIAHPDAVDVCSGVELSKGVKCAEKMREFVAAVRAAEGQE